MCNDYHPLCTDTPARNDEGAYTRRGFLGSSLAMLSAAATVPAFVSYSGSALADTTMRLSSKPGSAQDRVLVVIQLSGGNDGLNTIVPFGDSAYHNARPRIGLKTDDILKVAGGDGIGLAPQLSGVAELIEAGQAGVLQGVGYPNPNRSHFKSMDIWHQGTPDPTGRDRGKGWIGKALDTSMGASHPDSGLACVSIGDETRLACAGREVHPVNVGRPELFRWAGRDLHGDLSSSYDELATDASARGDDPAAFVSRTALDAQVASARIRKAVQQPTKARFPGTGLGQQLKGVANMIKAELPTRVYYTALGGFDTHAGQANRHSQLLTQFDGAVKAFQEELVATGHADRVVTFAFSEFGRRVRENASGGTDHGVAGPVFLFGPQVKPGLLGTYPSLTQLDQGDLIHTADFRGLYSELLSDWMKMPAEAAVAGQFASPGVLKVSA